MDGEIKQQQQGGGGGKYHHLNTHADVSCGADTANFWSESLSICILFNIQTVKALVSLRICEDSLAFLLDDAMSTKILCTCSYNVEASSQLLLHY